MGLDYILYPDKGLDCTGVKNHKMHKVGVDLCIPLYVDYTSKIKKREFIKILM